jgi:hypothetical protein
MPKYDDVLFSPPAPLATVTLRNPGNGWRVNDVPMLLDSGADVTLIPQIIADQLDIGTGADAHYELTGFDGRVSLAAAVRLEMIFLNKVFRGNYLVVAQPWGILGRDVLNLLSLLFDGPHLIWSEHRVR